MSSADEFRRHAEECVRLAKETTIPENRASLLTMAQSWRRLADMREARTQEKN
jgi:hypothetical protein